MTGALHKDYCAARGQNNAATTIAHTMPHPTHVMVG